jgi:hypothetical protein
MVGSVDYKSSVSASVNFHNEINNIVCYECCRLTNAFLDACFFFVISVASMSYIVNFPFKFISSWERQTCSFVFSAYISLAIISSIFVMSVGSGSSVWWHRQLCQRPVSYSSQRKHVGQGRIRD